MIGLYHPGTSVLHRAGAGGKLLGLALALTALILLKQPWQLGLAVIPVVGLYAVARIPVRLALRQLRPLLWVVPFIVVFHLVVTDWRRALVSAVGLILSVALAALLTLTTRVTAMLDLCRRGLGPLRRFGVDPDRVGLLLALTIRCVPLVATIMSEVWQAQKARGVTGVRNTAVAVAAPAVIRALRTADALGDALRARGVDD